jgi:hypothetical protein
MFNNYRVTGSVAQLPYQMYEAQYGLSPLFLWQSPKAEQPTYRHPVMEHYYQHENAETESKFSTLWDILREKTRALSELIHFFCGGTQYLLLVGLPLLLRRSRFRLAVLILVPVLIAAVSTPWTLTHYAAPAAPLIILITLASLVEISRWLDKRAYSPGRPAIGKQAVDATETHATSGSIFSTMTLSVVVLLILTLHSVTIYRNDQRANSIPWALRRQEILQQLTLQPGKYLVFVRYADDHNSHEEWVYNRADLDNANVVWARQISPEADAQLVDYFADRKVLIIDADRIDTADANRNR